jgi:acetolactate synthase-1/2/3 large subunit
MAGNTNGALGLKAAFPERTVVVGCGDGAYLMSGFELLTAVQHNLPVIWVIFNDGEFKLIKLYQLAAFLDHALVEFKNPDYVAYAKACGAEGYRVTNRGQFERAFKKALASGKPTIIDASITRLALPHYSPNPEGRLEGLWERLRALLHQPPRRGMLNRLWQSTRRRFGREEID